MYRFSVSITCYSTLSSLPLVEQHPAVDVPVFRVIDIVRYCHNVFKYFSEIIVVCMVYIFSLY